MVEERGADVFPDRSMEHRDKLAWMIEHDGWAIEPVPPNPDADPPKPGYAYTIGLETSFAFPELCIFGLTPVAARGLLAMVIGLVREGSTIPVGPLFTGLLDNELRSALLPVEVEDYVDLFESANAWHGRTDYRMLQLAWPDRNGWMPWEPGFDRKLLFAQPVLGALDDVAP